ncbi:unnamed protein product [Paramecium octaurelia]|uniref:Transmembrane protein n=1 Tax=Paramecium octaurelia TaxID=43137 RepID=A0A8S1XZ48_PAROT|nr:unnamed protein product [Paramecium octaurelia]
MINKYILLFITSTFAYLDDIYGVLEQNEIKNFTIQGYYTTQVSFLSFQGPIQFARVSEDGKLVELKPIPGTYFFYDYLNLTDSSSVTYRAYGSKGGATYPQYKFSTSNRQIDYQTPSLAVYKNQPINHRSEDGYLILDIPMVLQNDGTFIKNAHFLFNVGHQEDKELLKLSSSYLYSSKEQPKDYYQSDYNEMTFSNYYTTFYIKLEPTNTYDYFAVILQNYELPIGGSTFTINYNDSKSNTWIWILVTLIVVVLIIFAGWYLNHLKRKREVREDPQNFQQTFQQFS